MTRHVLLSSVKDEGPFVLEFVAHHRVLGFDAIHVASNDCSDGTDLLLDALAGNGAIKHLRNELTPGERPQRRAYEKMREAFGTDDADWVMALDVDEFLFVDTGTGRVGDLTALAGAKVDVIALSALSFGTSDSESWQPGLVTEQFVRRLPSDSAANAPVKSLSRGRGRWRGIQNHHPVGYRGQGDITVMRGDGAVMTIANDDKIWTHLRNFPPGLIAHDGAWYNHYPVKSIDSFLLRGLRGNGAEPVGDTTKQRWDEAYWSKFAAARIEDRRIIERYGKELRAEMNRLLSLPGVAEANADAEALYAERIAALDSLDG
ncbi:glycosyltransferase family 2 protein [Paracoccus albus]|uniref:glycosyltransferase family 2 protein n=1 Tax=Paracoccus albus TaxID=3017784 RepID=UPI0022F07E14|nr:glycosyltransferase family 2 protein [Paracoccus albus]WBU61269.1 glycosyltransferase family 2 protein [Paracoccus albus]